MADATDEAEARQRAHEDAVLAQCARNVSLAKAQVGRDGLSAALALAEARASRRDARASIAQAQAAREAARVEAESAGWASRTFQGLLASSASEAEPPLPAPFVAPPRAAAKSLAAMYWRPPQYSPVYTLSPELLARVLAPLPYRYLMGGVVAAASRALREGARGFGRGLVRDLRVADGCAETWLCVIGARGQLAAFDPMARADPLWADMWARMRPRALSLIHI